MERRFLVASTAGGLLAALLFAAVLSRGTTDLTAPQRVGDFYDAQADAWLDGQWDIDPDVLGIERFEARGRSYMYQGPTPALLRLPVAAVTDRFDGRLTQLSMLLALGVGIVFLARLHWRIRTLVRGPTPVGRAEAVAVAAGTFTVVAGSAVLFVASRAWVYHEAIMWGVALTLGALEGLLAFVTGRDRRWIWWTALLATLAVCARGSVGLGAVAGAALLAAGQAVHWWLHRSSQDDGALRRVLVRLRWLGPGADGQGRYRIPSLAAAAAVPVAVYAAVNWIKFRNLFSVPFESQGISLVDPVRQGFLEANDGSFFGAQFLPTTLVQYLRPDALDLTVAFPFVDFGAPTSPIGDVAFDLIDRTASIPSTMGALLLAAALGAWAVLRGRVAGSAPHLGDLRVPAIAAGVAGLAIFPFGYIAQRYLADLVPVLALLGLVGLQVALAVQVATRRAARLRRAFLALLAVAAVAGVWINLSLALVYQRLYSPNVEPEVIAAFVDTRYDVAQSLGLDPTIPVGSGERLPERAPRGSLFVIGDCDALYLSDGMRTDAIKHTPWNAVERAAAGGGFHLRVRFPDVPAATRQPLLSIDVEQGGDGMIWAERVTGGFRIAFGGPGFAAESDVLAIAPWSTHDVELVFDVQVRHVAASVDGVVAFETIAGDSLEATFAVGRDTVGRPGVDDRFTGRIERLPDRTRVCEELLSEAGPG